MRMGHSNQSYPNNMMRPVHMNQRMPYQQTNQQDRMMDF